MVLCCKGQVLHGVNGYNWNYLFIRPKYYVSVLHEAQIRIEAVFASAGGFRGGRWRCQTDTGWKRTEISWNSRAAQSCFETEWFYNVCQQMREEKQTNVCLFS